MSSRREVWVDYIKVLACILVVMGHFFQSLVKASILPDGSVFLWFNTTIYYFHVPLFFACSGYLYQRYSKVDTWRSWATNAVKKAVNLGIPFFTFSIITWVVKTVFADSTSNAIGGITEVLFTNPYPPYWYLYVLFFIFMLSPTIRSIKGLIIMLSTSAVLKIAKLLFPEAALWGIYALSGVASYEIWFVLGMSLAVVGAEKIKKRIIGLLLLAVFLGLSLYTVSTSNGFIELGMTALACLAVFMIMVLWKNHKALDKLAPYTMPVFLMHTLIAAPVRILLVKAGVSNALLHAAVGLIASIMGPVIAIKIMEKIKLDILVFPGRYIKIKA